MGQHQARGVTQEAFRGELQGGWEGCCVTNGPMRRDLVHGERDRLMNCKLYFYKNYKRFLSFFETNVKFAIAMIGF